MDELERKLVEEYGELKKIDMGVYQRSFVSGEPEGNRIRVQYFYRGEDLRLVGRVWFGAGAEGPPGHAHGGSICAVLDEAMGAASWVNGHIAVAASFSNQFREMIPLDSNIVVESWVEKIDGRKISIRGTLRGYDGRLYSEAEGLYVKIPISLSEKIIGELPLPPEIAKSLLENQERD